MDKTVIADFTGGRRQIGIAGLWRYDHGVTLEIRGLTLSSDTDIYFARDDNLSDGITVEGIITDDGIKYRIPDSLLAGNDRKFNFGNFYIYAWVYTDDTETGRTMSVVKIEVKRRPKPTGYVTDPDEAKTWASKADGLALEDRTLQLKSGENVLSSVELQDDTEIADKVNEISSEVKEVAQKADAAAESVATLSETVSGIKTDTEALDESVTSLSGTVSEVKPEIASLTERVEKLEEGGGTGGNIKFSVTEDGLLNIEYVEGGGGTGGITFSMTEDGLLNIDYKESEAA